MNEFCAGEETEYVNKLKETIRNNVDFSQHDDNLRVYALLELAADLAGKDGKDFFTEAANEVIIFYLDDNVSTD